MSVVIGIEALDRRLVALQHGQRQFLGNLQERAVAALKLRVPRKTSFTGRTIRPGSISDASATVIGSQVVWWLDQGTGLYGPHHQRIVPTHKQALSWHAGTTGPKGSLRLSGRKRKGKAGAGATRVTVRSTAGMRPRPFIEVSVRDAAHRSGLDDTAIRIWNDAA